MRVLIFILALFASTTSMSNSVEAATKLRMIVWGGRHCPPCRRMEQDGSVARLSAEGWPIAHYTVENWPEIARLWNIQSIPAIIVYDETPGGAGILEHAVGYRSYDGLLQLLRTHQVVRNAK